MAVNDPSTNFEWALPDVGGDTDVWDDDATEGLNTLFNEIDTDIQTEQDALDEVESDVTDLDTRVLSLESAQILPVYVRAAMLSASAIPTSTPTAISLSEVLDSVGMFDAGEPTRLTIPDGSDGPLSQDGRFNLGGLYKFKAFAHVPTWTGSDNSRAWTLTVRKNGTTDIASRRWPSFNAGQTNTEDELSLLVECMDEAGPGDYYELVLLTDSGLDAGVIRSATFEAYRLPSPRFAVARVLYSAGLDVHGNDSADFDRYNDATNIPGDGDNTWQASSGKFGGGNFHIGFVTAGRQTLRHVVLDTAARGGWAALYVKANTSGSSDQEHFRVLNGSTLHFTLESDSGGVLNLKDNGGTTLASSSTSLGASYRHIEAQWRLSTSGDGFVRVWIDGTLEIEETGLTLGNGSQVWDAYGYRGSSSFLRDYDVDDLVIQSSTGRRLGDGHRIYTVLPDADAGVNEWTPSSGSDHYAMVDDTDPDGSGTRLSTNTAAEREEFTFTLPSISGTIREVIVKALVDTDESQGHGIKLGLRIGGTEELSDYLPPPKANIYDEFWYAIAGNPNGGLLTEANLADAVILLENEGAGAAATQVWLEIITTA